jgi:transcriptional regulator with XRE-family HTH domain
MVRVYTTAARRCNFKIRDSLKQCPSLRAAGAVLAGIVTRGRPNPLHYRLAERLKQARKAAKMTRQGVSLAAGLSNNTAYFIEVDGRVPGLDVVEKLARTLHLSPSFLAYGLQFPFVASDALVCQGMGARLKSARESRGLAIRALARLAGTSDTTIKNAEAGRTIPTVATAEQIAKALGVSPCWLAYGEGPEILPKRVRQRTGHRTEPG